MLTLGSRNNDSSESSVRITRAELDELTPEQRKGILQMVVDEVIVHRNDNVGITLAIPIDSEPTTEDSVTATFLTPSRRDSYWSAE